MEISSAAYAPLSPTNLDNFKNPLRLPGESGVMGVLDASDTSVRITAQQESVEVVPGKRTELWAYRAERDGKTYVNPTIRVRKGKEFSAEFANDLDEETTVHWHGLHVDWQMDGHPFRPVAPQSTYRYAFAVQDRSATYWCHPHPHGGTARQSYAGLAGFFLVEDEEQQRLGEALDLRLGKTDIPLLIQDKVLDESGNFIYEPDAMALDMGYEGDVILINLTPTPYLEVSTRIYRLRLLNSSNARTYRLAFTKAGEKLVLKSLPFAPMHREHEMGGDMEHRGHMDHQMGPARLPDGSEFYLLRLVVKEQTDYTRRVPEILSEMPQPDLGEAASRPITISMTTDDDGGCGGSSTARPTG